MRFLPIVTQIFLWYAIFAASGAVAATGVATKIARTAASVIGVGRFMVRYAFLYSNACVVLTQSEAKLQAGRVPQRNTLQALESMPVDDSAAPLPGSF